MICELVAWRMLMRRLRRSSEEMQRCMVSSQRIQNIDEGKKQKAAMNIVVDQPRQECQKMADSIGAQNSEICQVVADSTTELRSINESCADFGI